MENLYITLIMMSIAIAFLVVIVIPVLIVYLVTKPKLKKTKIR